MSIKDMIGDMRGGEVGSMSKKGFEVRWRHGFCSRSCREVVDSSEAIGSLKQSCWANMPPELLRDVLMRIEASENTWPPRKYVVSCAGVCKSWREIMKEIVKRPEVSGKLTFPISLKQPGPWDSCLQCCIKRNRGNQTYHLYLGLNSTSYDDGKFLLAARRCRRPTCTDYVISLSPDYVAKGSTTYIGKLRSNFLGTKFTIYDGQPSDSKAAFSFSTCHSRKLVGFKQVAPWVPTGNYAIAHISYELNVLGSRGPRRMQCVMDAIPASAIEPGGPPIQTEFTFTDADSFLSIPFLRSKSTRMETGQSRPSPNSTNRTLVLKNKAPRWHDQLQCWCLNFNGRVTVASVKNFQLVATLEDGSECERVILQFGKVGKDVFTMDYQYPISAFQAFAICLSSFDTKIACE
ncbi:Tubby- protein 3 [Dionaea muscipula]